MTDQQALMQTTDLDTVMDRLLYAAESCANAATGEKSAAEAKDYSAAALQMAQAYTMLDPTRLTGGDTAEQRKAALPDPVPATRDSDRDGQIGEK